MRLIVLLAASAVLAGCGAEHATPKPALPKPPPPRVHADAPPWPRHAACPPGAVNCTAARGTVLYVERVDPDGDGDAHLVLASANSVSGPGITAIDIERERRPDPLPRVGDRVSAAGPVNRGSYGQRQIQATQLYVSRQRRPR